MSQGGYYYRLEGGKFLYCGDIGFGSSPGDLTVCVTGGPDNTTVQSLLHAWGALPLPLTGRWTVTYNALVAASIAGTRVVLTPTTA